MLNAALGLASRGFHVHPLHPRTKQPATRHGLHDATVDEATIRAWWGQDPNRNIGVATGEASGIVVIDVDSREGLAELHREGLELPPTLTAATGREGGGQHLYYQRPEGGLRNSASKLASGIDVRGDGGYVVAPPSIHPDTGRRFEWTHRVPPAPLPEWVAERLRAPERSEAAGGPTVGATVADGDADPWGRRVLEQESQRVRDAHKGARNDTLFQAACLVFEAVKGGHVAEMAAWRELATSAGVAGLDDGEAERTLESAWQRTSERHPAPRHGEPMRVAEPHAEGSVFLTLDDLDGLPQPGWLVPSVLPEGVTMIYGREGLGKTFLSLDWSLSLAARGRRVVYFLGEGVADLSMRRAAWMQAHAGHDPRSHFHVAADTTRGNLFPNLLEPQSVERTRERLRDLPGSPTLLVVDTWARAAPDAEESTALTNRAIRAVDALRHEFDASVLLVHHAGKNAAQGARGPQALSAAVDAVWSIKEADKSEDPFDDFLLWCDKARAFERPKRPRKYRIEQVGPSAAVFPSAVDEAV